MAPVRALVFVSLAIRSDFCLILSGEFWSVFDQSVVNKHLSIGIPIPEHFSSACPCGMQHDYHGYHRLNCKQNAGRANRAAHDLVQLALKKELQRLNLSVVDNDHELRQRFAHLSSQKRGDLAISSTSNYLIYDQVSR